MTTSSSIGEDANSFTETIQSIPEILSALSDVLSTPLGWLIVLGLFLWLIVNKDFSHLFDLAERKKKNQLRDIETYVTNKDAACDDSMSVIKDFRDAYYFKVATGIYAEQKLRESLIELHRITSNTISWVDIRRAISFILVDENKNIKVRDFNWFEKFSYYYNFFVAFLFGFTAILVLIALLVSASKGTQQIFFWIVSLLFCFCVAVYSLAQNWPIESAKKIKKELKK
ncbi:hypothetical protein [Endozoicomonas sp. ONNA1]|uniref:hypothetical protein n=1 Tax=Endozoicomonas sp. ONNA1 TaxID=2828740 RepID=UPI002148F0C6|nr:hypothetical protein [Endozoicomonas sp. ONNA1]